MAFLWPIPSAMPATTSQPQRSRMHCNPIFLLSRQPQHNFALKFWFSFLQKFWSPSFVWTLPPGQGFTPFHLHLTTASRRLAYSAFLSYLSDLFSHGLNNVISSQSEILRVTTISLGRKSEIQILKQTPRLSE